MREWIRYFDPGPSWHIEASLPDLPLYAFPGKETVQ